MKILVAGSGGREHTLVWKLNQSSEVDEIYCAPGNPGTAEIGWNVDIGVGEHERLLEFCLEEEIDLTVVGPEAPLVEGLVDKFREADQLIFGPESRAARLEGSKVFAKRLMQEAEIPTAPFRIFSDANSADSFLQSREAPVVVKADGLAAGKGVFVCSEIEEARRAVEKIMVERKFGEAGDRIVIEEKLEGEEASVLALVDGENYKTMVSSQDHKAAYEGGRGPNTGGMGAIAPAPLMDAEMRERIESEVLEATLAALEEKGIEFKGIIYCGLMIKENKDPYVLEFNVRFGDPEAQVVLPLLENDLAGVLQAAAEGRLEEVNLKWSDKAAACVVMASGGYPRDYETGKKIEGIERAEADDRFVFQAGTAEAEDRVLTAGGRVLGVTALGEDLEHALDKAYRGVEKISFPDAHFRSDIGAKALERLRKEDV